MAKVLLGVLLGDIRGKAGQAVFSRAKSGATVRQRVVGTNPQSERQSEVRAQLASVSRKWTVVLDASERTAWNSYGDTLTKTDPISGRQYHPAGFSEYTGLTMNFLRFAPSGTPPTDPPATAFDEPTVTLDITEITDGSFDVDLSLSAASPANTAVEWLYQPLASVGRQYQADAWKSGGFFVDVATPFTGTGTIPTNDHGFPAYALAYRWMKTTTGQVGQIHVLGTFIPA